MTISATDPAVNAALDDLRRDPELGAQVRKLDADKATIIITLILGRGGSATDPSGAPALYNVYLDPASDDKRAQRMWGIKGTALKNSLVHELSHVYSDLYLKGKSGPPPSTVTADKWEEIISECRARQWDTRVRPKGVIVPCVDRPRSAWEKALENAGNPINPLGIPLSK